MVDIQTAHYDVMDDKDNINEYIEENIKHMKFRKFGLTPDSPNLDDSQTNNSDEEGLHSDKNLSEDQKTDLNSGEEGTDPK